MEENIESSNNNLKNIILNTKEPLVIKNQINSDLISWSLNEWGKVLENELLQFRCGKNQYTVEPQWESSCSIKEVKFKDFLEIAELNKDEWWYFDYKYLSQWFTNKHALREKIDWSSLGFPEISANDSTIWIGSKGAHTSCHKDTYGCNMVFQIFGRKLWLLFPPEQNLRPTRIPFEESSIYSKLNFFSPNINTMKGFSKCHKVILNPGEVLVVPNKWWHYVENLETAISVNAWLPLPEDYFERTKESIATILLGKMTENHKILQDAVLNPNMMEEMIGYNEALNIITAHSDKYQTINKVQKTSEHTSKTLSESLDIEELIKQNENIFNITSLSDFEFKSFLTSQLGRFSKCESYQGVKKNIDCKNMIDFLEVITDDEVLELIAKKLIQKL